MNESNEPSVARAHWSGDLDGVLVIERTDAEALAFDRPGDVVNYMTGRAVDPPELFRAIACSCFALATRGITQPEFIRPIVDKTTPFAASCDPPSLVLYREAEQLRTAVKDSELEGLELRQFILEAVEEKLRASRS